MRLTRACLVYSRVPAGRGLMLAKATLTAITIFCSPAGSAELQSYRVTVLEQIRYDITVQANEESAARTLALLEARRTSRFGSPAWEPSPPAVIANARESNDFAAIKIEPLFTLAAPTIAASGGRQAGSE
jgi:hypothetical protein